MIGLALGYLLTRFIIKSKVTSAETNAKNIVEHAKRESDSLKKEIVFQAGSHQQAVWMSMTEYRKLTNPTIGTFSYPASFDEIESMPFDPFFYDPYGM